MPYDPSDPAAKESALQPHHQKTLTEANYLMENGKPGQAAPLYAKLAEVLASAGQPRRASNLHAQAAMAFARHREEAPALVQARAALTFFVQHRVGRQAEFFYANITREMTKRGMKNAADALVKEFSSKVVESKPVAQPATALRFPTTCPQCGGPVRTDEVHWIDDGTVECDFCGTPIHSSAE